MIHTHPHTPCDTVRYFFLLRTGHKMPSLSDAAEQLVLAARLEVESSSKAKEQEALAELKHIHSSSDKVVAAVECLAGPALGDIKTVLTETHLKLSSVQNALEKVENAVNSSARVSRLQWAVTNANVFMSNLDYVDDSGQYQCGNSAESFAREVLGCFLTNKGRYVQGFKLNRQDQDGSKFRAELGDRLHKLTGAKPRFALQSDKWIVWEC